MKQILNYTLKRQSNFTPSDRKLLESNKLLWLIYSVSSFSFMFLSIPVYRCKKKYALFLIIQSLLSYLNDVKYLGYDTIWRPIDRIIAPLHAVFLFASLKRSYEFFYVPLFYFISLYLISKNQKRAYLVGFSMWHILPVIIVPLRRKQYFCLVE